MLFDEILLQPVLGPPCFLLLAANVNGNAGEGVIYTENEDHTLEDGGQVDRAKHPAGSQPAFHRSDGLPGMSARVHRKASNLQDKGKLEF